MEAADILDKERRDSNITRIRNRCIKTGRSRGIIKKMKMSRIEFKK